MKSGKTHILVEVDTLYNNTIESKLMNSDGEKIKFQFDPSFEPYKYVKTSATVVGVPDEYLSEPLTAKHNYFPRMRGEHTTFYTTLDFPNPDIRVGDKVYFHYLSLRPSKEEQFSVSYVTQEGKNQIHLIDNKNLQLYIRDGQITMLFGNCLISPMYEDGVEDVEIKGHKVKCKVTDSGIVTSVGEHPKLQEGIVKYINPTDFELSRKELKNGDSVVFLKNAKFKNEVEGEEYYIMKEWDIVAKKEDNDYIPLNDFLCIKEIKVKKSSLITEGFIKESPNKIGEIVMIGTNCDDLKVGDQVYYNSKSPYHIEFNDITYIRKQEVFAYYEN